MSSMLKVILRAQVANHSSQGESGLPSTRCTRCTRCTRHFLVRSSWALWMLRYWRMICQALEHNQSQNISTCRSRQQKWFWGCCCLPRYRKVLSPDPRQIRKQLQAASLCHSLVGPLMAHYLRRRYRDSWTKLQVVSFVDFHGHLDFCGPGAAALDKVGSVGAGLRSLWNLQ